MENKEEEELEQSFQDARHLGYVLSKSMHALILPGQLQGHMLEPYYYVLLKMNESVEKAYQLYKEDKDGED